MKESPFIKKVTAYKNYARAHPPGLCYYLTQEQSHVVAPYKPLGIARRNIENY